MIGKKIAGAPYPSWCHCQVPVLLQGLGSFFCGTARAALLLVIATVGITAAIDAWCYTYKYVNSLPVCTARLPQKQKNKGCFVLLA